MPKRIDLPVRCRAIRSDSTVGAAERKLARDLKLPGKMVKFFRPDGRDVRSDCLIKTLRKMWG